MVAIWLYFVLACMIVVALLTGMGVEIIAAAIGAGLIIAPMMIGLLVWLNKETGSGAHLTCDRESDTIALPRLELSFPREQVEMLVSLNRFIDDRINFWQIAILVRQEGQWLYAHVCNEVNGTASIMGWKVKSRTEIIAESIDVPFVVLKFNRKESRLLKEQAWNDATPRSTELRLTH